MEFEGSTAAWRSNIARGRIFGRTIFLSIAIFRRAGGKVCVELVLVKLTVTKCTDTTWRRCGALNIRLRFLVVYAADLFH
jgi:hypothetical protein